MVDQEEIGFLEVFVNLIQVKPDLKFLLSYDSIRISHQVQNVLAKSITPDLRALSTIIL